MSAFPVRPVKIIGDIGVRGFVSLCRRILRIIDHEGTDFLYIPVPPFFAAPLGRVVHALRKVPYGIDYIDPWVHQWPPHLRRFTKHWVSWKLGELLEPFAVRDASLITGVAGGYFAGVLNRNPKLSQRVVTAAMPYGGEQSDHRTVASLGITPYIFQPGDGRVHLVYAGALLPRAIGPLEAIFRSIAANRDAFRDTRLHFIGTGKSPDDASAYSVRPLAERYDLWPDIVLEHPRRIPYLDVLVHLAAADGVFILGSTEPHYTPSKVFQGVLSGKPILAILHSASTARDVLQQTGAGIVVAFDGERDVASIEQRFLSAFTQFRTFASTFDPSSVDRTAFEAYTARSTTRLLANAMDTALDRVAATGAR